MAFYGLGNTHWNGDGVPAHHTKARALFSKALDLGVGVAAESLGRMLWDGEGGPVDKAGAKAIWTRGAALGDPWSHERLAWVAELGRDGTAQDLPEALLNYGIATRLYEAAGDEEAAKPVRYRRGSLARVMDPQVVADLWPKVRDWVPVTSQTGEAVAPPKAQ